jgi:hypothetical protein
MESDRARSRSSSLSIARLAEGSLLFFPASVPGYVKRRWDARRPLPTVVGDAPLADNAIQCPALI